VAEQADLWIAVGFSFSQSATSSWTVAKPEKVIHVDVDESQLGRIFQPSLSIVADAKTFLGQLNSRVKAPGAEQPDYVNSPRVAEIARSKDSYFEFLRSFKTRDPIMPAAIGQVLAEEVPDQTLLVNDEGFMVPGMVYRGDKYPSGFATALGFHYASLGSALPVAIGAKLAEPERLVISVGGDAGFFYYCGDLSTLAEHNLKIVSIVINNGGLFGGRRGRAPGGGPALPSSHWTDLPDVDYTAIAQGLGVQAERVEKADELAPAIRRAIAADGPYFLEVQAAASTMHLHLMAMATSPEPADGNPRKLGHGDRIVKGSWPC
jgi:acetolactate synthase-1/2/3 large subunit